MQELSNRKQRMLRKQVFITAEQNRRLKALAAATGQSEGALIRGAVQRMLEEKGSEGEDWKSSWLAAAGMWKHYPEIDEIIAEGRRSWRRRRERLFGRKDK